MRVKILSKDFGIIAIKYPFQEQKLDDQKITAMWGVVSNNIIW
jgi:hypothetical protein